MDSETIKWNCYKVAPSLPLMAIASFFGFEDPIKWKKNIKLDGNQLASVLKYADNRKAVFLFEFGCITFVNITTEENRRILEYLESISCNIASDLLVRYRYSFSIHINESGMYHPFLKKQGLLLYDEDVVPVISAALAKDTQLFWLEDEMENLLDKSESVIDRLRRAKLNINTLKYSRELALMLRFQYNSAYSVRVFDRSDAANSSLSAKNLYDEFMADCCFHDRLDVLQQKSDELHHIFNIYSILSQSWKENRLLYFEILLLVLFTLPYAINFKSFLHFILSVWPF